MLDFELAMGVVSETVTVQAEAKYLDERSAHRERDATQLQVAPSQNVLNLQRRVAGVLPVRIDVPRTGTAHRFIRPLVLDEDTRVTFKYKRR